MLKIAHIFQLKEWFDISRSTSAVEVLLALRYFTNRPASNETIKRGGQIFWSNRQNLQGYSLADFENSTKNFLLQILKVLVERIPNLKEFLFQNDWNMVIFNFKVN